MKAFNRRNKHGIRFKYVELPGNRTEITVHMSGAVMVLDHPIDKVMDSFQHWNEGMFIQDAFDFLTDSEREFIKLGITDAQWNLMFPTDGEN